MQAPASEPRDPGPVAGAAPPRGVGGRGLDGRPGHPGDTLSLEPVRATLLGKVGVWGSKMELPHRGPQTGSGAYAPNELRGASAPALPRRPPRAAGT